jgi:hypothetical protein
LKKKTSMEDRLCLECRQPLSGRADKKFCDDQCRSSYNNRLNSDSSKLVRTINGILRKNRQILCEFSPDGKNKVKREKLIVNGLDTQYHTHTYVTKEGAVYRFCYEYGWLQLDSDFFLIVKND